MPVLDPNCPPRLKSALEDMENAVQHFKGALSYTAPEMFDRLFGELQMELAQIIGDLFEGVWRKTA